jgi:hypothetical protein
MAEHRTLDAVCLCLLRSPDVGDDPVAVGMFDRGDRYDLSRALDADHTAASGLKAEEAREGASIG